MACYFTYFFLRAASVDRSSPFSTSALCITRVKHFKTLQRRNNLDLLPSIEMCRLCDCRIVCLLGDFFWKPRSFIIIIIFVTCYSLLAKRECPILPWALGHYLLYIISEKKAALNGRLSDSGEIGVSTR